MSEVLTAAEAFEKGRSLGMDHGEAQKYANSILDGQKEVAAKASSLTPETVEVGDGVTMGVGSDRYPGTIVSKSPSGKTIGFTMDNYKALPGSSIYGHQSYEYESVEAVEGVNPLGETTTNVRTARWNAAKGGYMVFGRRLAAGRSYYYDPHV